MKQIDAQIDALDELHRTIEGLKETEALHESEVSSLRSQLCSAQGQADTLQAKLQEFVEVERDELLGRVAALSTELLDVKSLKETSDVVSAKRLFALEIALKEIGENLSSCRLELISKSDELSSCHVDLTAMKDELSISQLQLVDVSKALSSCQLKLHTSQERLESMSTNRESREVADTQQKIISKLNQRLSSRDSQLVQLREEVSQAESNATENASEISLLHQTIRELRVKNDALSDEMGERESSLAQNYVQVLRNYVQCGLV